MTGNARRVLEYLCVAALGGRQPAPADARELVGVRAHIDFVGRDVGLSPDAMDAALANLEVAGYLSVSGEAVVLDPPAARWYAHRLKKNGRTAEPTPKSDAN